jgi:type I restriction enzyme S subunit
MVPLSEVVDILDSKRVPVNSSERAKRSGIVPYYGATGQVGYIDSHLFDEELILLGEDGAPFLDPGKPKAYLIKGKSWVNNHAHVLRGKAGLLNSFLLYQLNNIDYRPYVSGTTRLKLPQGPMKQIPLLVPSPDEQRQIVAEIEKQFTRLEAGVTALKRVQANLKRYRAAVLKAACEGKLVPTEAELAKAEGRSYENGEHLLQRILTERRKNWSGRGKYKEPAPPDTENLDQLNEGWVWSSLAQLAAHITDGTHKTPKYMEQGVPFLSAKDITGFQLSFDRCRYISHSEHEDLSKRCMVRRGNVLITKSGTIGRVTVVETDTEFSLFESVANVPVIHPMEAKFVSVAAFVGISGVFGAANQKGVAVRHLHLEDLRRVPIPLPPLAEQKRIVEEVERRLSVIDELETVVKSNLQRATRLRQSILQNAYTGKLTKNIK